MTTRRRRRPHGSTLPHETWLMLALGAGMSSCPDAELRATWREWGAAVTARGRREYGETWRPFLAIVAEAEGWDRGD